MKVILIKLPEDPTPLYNEVIKAHIPILSYDEPPRFMLKGINSTSDLKIVEHIVNKHKGESWIFKGDDALKQAKLKMKTL